MIKKIIKKTIKNVVRYFFKNNRQKDWFLSIMFKTLERDPLLFVYNSNGILNYENDIISGEYFLISVILPKYISVQKEAIIFDVGANSGEYSLKLASNYSKSFIYSFEPNVNTFNLLKEKVQTIKKIIPINIGLSDIKKEGKLYTYSNDLNSQHASIYKEVFSDLHKENGIARMNIELEKLDFFCEKYKIDIIDFLKIDTEGNELDVLKGSIKKINEGKIKIIQFEFNEMNIISRVFLRDFYEILKDYRIYRLSEKKLIPLFKYNSTNEIFKFQNLLAIHKSMDNV